MEWGLSHKARGGRSICNRIVSPVKPCVLQAAGPPRVGFWKFVFAAFSLPSVSLAR